MQLCFSEMKKYKKVMSIMICGYFIIDSAYRSSPYSFTANGYILMIMDILESIWVSFFIADIFCQIKGGSYLKLFCYSIIGTGIGLLFKGCINGGELEVLRDLIRTNIGISLLSTPLLSTLFCRSMQNKEE